jgi:beta-galactosidase
MIKSTPDRFTEKKFFPFGPHYFCNPTPLPDEWDQDLAEIAKAGYTHIQFRTIWRCYERIRGEFFWDELDQLFDLAAKHGLRVILKPMLENAPDWVFTELEGSRIGFHDIPMTRTAMNSAYYAGGFMPCFDNPQVIDASVNYLKELTKRYCDHPALWCYDAWNEPRSRPMSQCNCPHSQELYRTWLKNEFGTIEELNAKLHKSWTSYDEVIPPVSNACLVEMFLWRQWASHAVSGQIKFVCDAIKSVDTSHPVMVHVGCNNIFRDPAVDPSDDFQNSQHVERYGFSMNLAYKPKTPLDHDSTEYQSAWLARIDEAYWCHELYPRGPKWHRPIEEKTLKRHIWMAIAGGCGGLTFWEYRSARMGIMSKGFGMRDVNGSATETSVICDEIALKLKDYGKKLVNTRRAPARIGMLYALESDLLHRLLKMHIWMGKAQNVMPDVDYSYKEALRGAHVAYTGIGENVDWFVSGDDISKLQVLHVACNENFGSETAEWLREFVENGGTLIIESPFACRDEKNWIHFERPAYGLNKLLGCSEENRFVIHPDDDDIATFDNGAKITAKYWRTDLELESGTPFAKWQDGKIAAVKNACGKGLVYTLGCSPSMAFSNQWDDPLFGLFEWILRDAGLPVAPTFEDRQLWVRRRIGDDFEIRFIFNVSNKTRQIKLPAEPNLKVYESAVEQLNSRKFDIAPGGTLVVEMSL